VSKVVLNFEGKI